ncbi:MAG: hypothetical protein GWN00_10905, partial [Aliifodinibius sp.]|nr:hypothetical protein [Fodinibius sp.]NIY25295.1 hypothetical protein [Fodinibius sp.]
SQDNTIDTFTATLYLGQVGSGSLYLNGEMDAVQLIENNIFSASSSPGIGDSITVPITEPALGATSGNILLQSVAVDVAPSLAAPDTIKILIDLEDIDP